MSDRLEDLFIEFWAKVERSGDCLVWTGVKDTEKYGQFQVNGKPKSAYRVAYNMIVGEIPEGLELDHLCRNHSCVNPEHLEAVTHQENARRAGIFRRRTHCIKKNHPLTPDNLYYSKDARGSPQRRCKKCSLANGRRRFREQQQRQTPELKGRGGAILTPIQVINIWHAKGSIDSHKLSKFYGVASRTIRDIWCKRTWNNLKLGEK